MTCKVCNAEIPAHNTICDTCWTLGYKDTAPTSRHTSVIPRNATKEDLEAFFATPVHFGRHS